MIVYGCYRLASIQIPGKGNWISHKAVYIKTFYLDCMESFFQISCIQIVGPEFLSICFYRMFFISIQNKLYTFHSIIIDTSSNYIQITYNPHARTRICNTTYWEIRIWINIKIIRPFNKFISTKVFGCNEDIVLTLFLTRKVKGFLPAFHIFNLLFLYILSSMCIQQTCRKCKSQNKIGNKKFFIQTFFHIILNLPNYILDYKFHKNKFLHNSFTAYLQNNFNSTANN